jgi:hypothetical protein
MKQKDFSLSLNRVRRKKMVKKFFGKPKNFFGHDYLVA